MYSDYAQMQQYDEYLQQKAHEFQAAQLEAAWVGQGLRRCLNQVGDWLVIGGQRLQTVGAEQRGAIVSAAPFVKHEA
jgi:hypothetical protein